MVYLTGEHDILSEYQQRYKSWDVRDKMEGGGSVEGYVDKRKSSYFKKAEKFGYKKSVFNFIILSH